MTIERDLAGHIVVALRCVQKPELKAMLSDRSGLRDSAIEEFAAKTAKGILGRYELTERPWTDLGTRPDK